MAGRKPLPTNLHILHGNPGGRPLNQNEPKPGSEKPRCPSHLSDEAKREWKRIADKLHRAGLLTEIDGAALAAYCAAYGRWVEAEQNIKRYGTVIMSPDKGWPIQSPYLAVANRAMEQMRQYLVEFGMTPSSRSRLSVAPKDAAIDPMEELLNGRRSAS